jgi:adenylate kinase family enzyme
VRVFVTGPTGSGKTTLAKKFALKACLPLLSLDDIHWVRHPSGDRRRDPLERLEMLNRLVRHDAWINEGVQFKWADSALERADHIVVVDIPRWRNVARILQRCALRRLLPRPNPRGTLAALREEMGWSSDYYGHERAMLFEKISPWSDKVLVARNQRSERAVEDALLAGRRSAV